MHRNYYLAYGSNLNKEQMSRRCPGARAVGTSVIQDYRLLFRGSKTGSYLTIEPKAGREVPVAVWLVSDENESALDLYEGFPRFYYKAQVKVPVKSFRTGKTVNRLAFVYIMHKDRAISIPSKTYVRTCFAGYQAFGFDEKYLREAYQLSEIWKGALNVD